MPLAPKPMGLVQPGASKGGGGDEVTEHHRLSLAATLLLLGPVVLLTILLGGAIFQHFTMLSAEMARFLEMLFALVLLLAAGGTLTLLFLAGAKVWRAYVSPRPLGAKDGGYVMLDSADGSLVALDRPGSFDHLADTQLDQNASHKPYSTPGCTPQGDARPIWENEAPTQFSRSFASEDLPPLSTFVKPGYTEGEVLQIAWAARVEMAGRREGKGAAAPGRAGTGGKTMTSSLSSLLL